MQNSYLNLKIKNYNFYKKIKIIIIFSFIAISTLVFYVYVQNQKQNIIINKFGIKQKLKVNTTFNFSDLLITDFDFKSDILKQNNSIIYNVQKVQFKRTDKIELIKVSKKHNSSIILIPYLTLEEEEPTLQLGSKITLVNGENGSQTIEIENIFYNDKLHSTKIIKSTTKEPINKKILIGIKDFNIIQTTTQKQDEPVVSIDFGNYENEQLPENVCTIKINNALNKCVVN